MESVPDELLIQICETLNLKTVSALYLANKDMYSRCKRLNILEKHPEGVMIKLSHMNLTEIEEFKNKSNKNSKLYDFFIIIIIQVKSSYLIWMEKLMSINTKITKKF